MARETKDERRGYAAAITSSSQLNGDGSGNQEAAHMTMSSGCGSENVSHSFTGIAGELACSRYCRSQTRALRVRHKRRAYGEEVPDRMEEKGNEGGKKEERGK